MSTLQERLRGRVVQRWIHSTGTSPHASGVKPDGLCAEAADRLDALEREVEALRADAERYRWLRLPTSNVSISHEAARDAELYDAAIDAARSKTR